MIISHQHKFIFFPIPKTGTHSIRFALRPFLGPTDEEHVSLFHKSRLSFKEFESRVDGHISVKEIKPLLSQEIWDSYFKFTFVRNSWEKFISTIVFRNPSLLEESDLILPYAQHKLKEIDKSNLFYKDQLDFLLDENNELGVDFIGRVSDMQSDFETICERLSLPVIQLDKKNKTDYSLDLTSSLIESIAQVYRKDINYFGFESPKI